MRKPLSDYEEHRYLPQQCFLKSGALPSTNSHMESQEITKSENTLVKKVWGFSELVLPQPSSSPTPWNL